MILMYHHVAPASRVPAESGPEYCWNLVHSPEAFERQLRTLRQRGYSFTSLDEAVHEIGKRGSEPRKTIQLSFDDGWRDNYDYAFPILLDLGLTATFFTTTGHIFERRDDPAKVGVAELAEMLAAGMSIGAHTRRHTILTDVPFELAVDEIAGSKADLESALATEIRLFAYPGGAFNRSIAAAVEAAGYAAACSVLGPARNDRSSLFWLYRDALTEGLDTLGDRYRCSPAARRLFSFRVKRRLRKRLDAAPVEPSAA